MSEIIDFFAEKIKKQLLPIRFQPSDYDPLLEWVGAARIVMLGGATLGTHEFHRERARITQRLIEELGFNAIAIEADWPAVWRVNQYVRGAGGDETAEEALGDLKGFPLWSWRNTDTAAFVEWLKNHNAARTLERQAGFYGLDRYNLYRSAAAALEALDRDDPAAAARARYRFSLFDQYGEEPGEADYAAETALAPERVEALAKELAARRDRDWEALHRENSESGDPFFQAPPDTRLQRSAPRFYRALFKNGNEAWNMRERQMAATLEATLEGLGRHMAEPRLVVWTHNVHCGDARATEPGRHGLLSMGSLLGKRQGEGVWRVGFTTYEGEVTVASSWDGGIERRLVRPLPEDSCEGFLHQFGEQAALANLRQPGALRDALLEARLQRAIGAVYRPQTELLSHTFNARPARQFDVLIHLDQTRAAEPLDRTPEWEEGEESESYPIVG